MGFAKRLQTTWVRGILMTAAAVGMLTSASLTAQQPPDVKPGPEHELLKQDAGAWDLTFKSPAGDSKGTLMAEMGLGGLWLLEHVKADFGGAAFEGHGGSTYDAAKKKYVSVWIDSMSTSPTLSEGTYDKSTKTLTMAGTMPAPDGKTMKVTMVTVYTDANTKTFTVKGPGPDGKEAQMFQILYKRRVK